MGKTLKALFFESVLMDKDRERAGHTLPLVAYVADEFHRFITADRLHGRAIVSGHLQIVRCLLRSSVSIHREHGACVAGIADGRGPGAVGGRNHIEQHRDEAVL